MKKSILEILPILIIIITIFSAIQWLKNTVNSTYATWIVNFSTILIILHFYIKKKKVLQNHFIYSSDHRIIAIYFIWLILNSIRGAFIAENYWEWKQLITGIQSLTLPLLVFIFSIPLITGNILYWWFKYIYLFLILIPFVNTGAYHFYLGPVFVVGCFIPIVPKKWKIIFGILLVTMLVINLGARSQVIKSAMVMLVAIGIYFRHLVPYKLIKIAHWTCYIAPIVLLTLGLTGTFNIFEDLSSNKGKYVEKKVVNGQVVEDDLSADTRTFIYVEVIESALRHNYVIWGRTPARGNDSMAFGAYNAEELKTGKYERHANELCHTNVFTWLGLIGVILYSLIYLRSSYLAVYKSNNIYIKFLGCFIAFRWAYGWVEDMNRFNIMNISIWIMIAMGLSIQFRSMNNKQFRLWVNNIFNRK